MNFAVFAGGKFRAHIRRWAWAHAGGGVGLGRVGRGVTCRGGLVRGDHQVGGRRVAWSGVAGDDPRGQPYVGWLNAARRAAQAAGQARLAAAFEATLAATVSPAMVAANRTRLASLVAANLLGPSSGDRGRGG